MSNQLSLSQHASTFSIVNNAHSSLLAIIKQSETNETIANNKRNAEERNICSAIIAYANSLLGAEFVGFHDSQADSVKLGVKCSIQKTGGIGCTGVLRMQFINLCEKTFKDSIFDISIHFANEDEQFSLGDVIADTFQVSARGTNNPFVMVKQMQQSISVIDTVMDGVHKPTHPLHHAITNGAINALAAIKQVREESKIKDKAFSEAVESIFNGLRADFNNQKAKAILDDLVAGDRKRAKLMLPKVWIDEDGIYIELRAVNASVHAGEDTIISMKHNKRTDENLNLSKQEGKAALNRIANRVLIPSDSFTTSDNSDFNGSYFQPFTLTQE